MRTYKLYILDGTLKIAGPAQFIEAATDEEAVEMALGIVEGDGRCELWDGLRLVGRLPLPTASVEADPESTSDLALRQRHPLS
jgi:hypothetical protein